jgi:hypothetical protein
MQKNWTLFRAGKFDVFVHSFVHISGAPNELFLLGLRHDVVRECEHISCNPRQVPVYSPPVVGMRCGVNRDGSGDGLDMDGLAFESDNDAAGLITPPFSYIVVKPSRDGNEHSEPLKLLHRASHIPFTSVHEGVKHARNLGFEPGLSFSFVENVSGVLMVYNQSALPDVSFVIGEQNASDENLGPYFDAKPGLWRVESAFTMPGCLRMCAANTNCTAVTATHHRAIEHDRVRQEVFFFC